MEIRKIEMRKRVQILGSDGSNIVIERVVIGNSLCWHLHHGKTRIITRHKKKINMYVKENKKKKNSYGEIVDLGEY